MLKTEGPHRGACYCWLPSKEHCPTEHFRFPFLPFSLVIRLC